MDMTMMESLSRMPPHNMEAEQSVLGCMLLDKESVATATDFLKAEDFYAEAHKEIFESMLDIYDHGDPVDLVTVTEQLRQRGTLEAVGGVAYISDLSMVVPSTANIRYYVSIVEEKSILRRLISVCNEIIKQSYEAREELDLIIDHAEKSIFQITQRNTSSDFEPIKTVLLETYARIEEMSKNKGRIIGIPTGFTDFDQKTSGLQPSDFILVAARPSMGKTSFVLNIAQHAALHENVPVAIFSLEMSREQLVQRMLSSEANVELQKIRTGDLDEREWIKLVEAAGPLSQAPIYIDDTPGISAMEIRSKARRLKMEKGLGMIIIDYLQLMTGRGRVENQHSN
jgi:replicative DNA helicase